jgi:hypothetical protein
MVVSLIKNNRNNRYFLLWIDDCIVLHDFQVPKIGLNSIYMYINFSDQLNHIYFKELKVHSFLGIQIFTNKFKWLEIKEQINCSWNIKTHYLHFKHFIITITDDHSPC